MDINWAYYKMYEYEHFITYKAINNNVLTSSFSMLTYSEEGPNTLNVLWGNERLLFNKLIQEMHSNYGHI